MVAPRPAVGRLETVRPICLQSTLLRHLPRSTAVIHEGHSGHWRPGVRSQVWQQEKRAKPMLFGCFQNAARPACLQIRVLLSA
jgi:hypothetical protein